ncbi:MAG TPA: deoxyribonuclease IV [Verrucomicrobiae bacterium]|nr:deoxyribonuclease IV [Verrucomicrobiae bacterium]
MKIKLGVHVSISGSLSNSIDRALNSGCSTFQIFTRSPRQWKTREISIEESDRFKEKLKNTSISFDSVVVHMPYLPNLSAPDSKMYQQSLKVLEDEIVRCSILQIPNLVIHLGSHLGHGSENGICQLINACNTALNNYLDSNTLEKNDVKILLENSAGQKNSIGSSFEEIKSILDRLNSNNFGVCLDTCHAFAAGYDLSTEKGSLQVLDALSDIIGIDKIKVIHLNDSKGELGSKLDRHYHIGIGKMGNEGFKALLNNKKISHIPFIMETPIDDIRSDKDNITYAQDLIR